MRWDRHRRCRFFELQLGVGWGVSGTGINFSHILPEAWDCIRGRRELIVSSNQTYDQTSSSLPRILVDLTHVFKRTFPPFFCTPHLSSIVRDCSHHTPERLPQLNTSAKRMTCTFVSRTSSALPSFRPMHPAATQDPPCASQRRSSSSA